MQSYATYTWPWQNPNSVWSPPWMRQAAAYQQPPPQHQTSYGYYNNAYSPYEQPQPQPAPPSSSWQPSYSEEFLRLMAEQDQERSDVYYLSASEPEEVMEDDNATYAYVDLQEFLRLMAEQDQERSGAYYLSASEPEEVMEDNNGIEVSPEVPQNPSSPPQPPFDFDDDNELDSATKQIAPNETKPPSTMNVAHSSDSIPPPPSGVPQIRVCFNIVTDTYNMAAAATLTGQKNNINITNDKGTLSKGDIKHMMRAAEQIAPTFIFIVEFDSTIVPSLFACVNFSHGDNRSNAMANNCFCVFDPGGGIGCLLDRCTHLEDKVDFIGGGVDTVKSHILEEYLSYLII